MLLTEGLHLADACKRLTLRGGPQGRAQLKASARGRVAVAVGDKLLQIDGTVAIRVCLAELLCGALVQLLATCDPILCHARSSNFRYEKILIPLLSQTFGDKCIV